MSPARSDQVNAIELAGRSATLEREPGLTQMPRLVEAGALAGTRLRAVLEFGRFDGRPTVELRVEGIVLLTCQRCLRPCECRIDEAARLMIVADGDEDAPGGFEAVPGDAERLSLAELIEEQALLGNDRPPAWRAERDATPGATGAVS